MLFCHIKVVPFVHEKIRYMGIYVPRNFITTAKQVVMIEAIKYLGKYIPYTLSFHVRKKQSIYDKIAFLYFTLIRFRENYSLNSREGVHFLCLYCSTGHSSLRIFGIDRSCA